VRRSLAKEVTLRQARQKNAAAHLPAALRPSVRLITVGWGVSVGPAVLLQRRLRRALCGFGPEYLTPPPPRDGPLPTLPFCTSGGCFKTRAGAMIGRGGRGSVPGSGYGDGGPAFFVWKCIGMGASHMHHARPPFSGCTPGRGRTASARAAGRWQLWSDGMGLSALPSVWDGWKASGAGKLPCSGTQYRTGTGLWLVSRSVSELAT
jgi:hypothetical protein